MSIQPCSYGDGMCKIPDRTLVVHDGVVAVRSRKEIEAEFPSIDLSRSLLQEVVIADVDRRSELVDAFENPERSTRSLNSFTSATGHSLADELIADAESGPEVTEVYVYCSPCKHLFKTKLSQADALAAGLDDAVAAGQDEALAAGSE